MLDLQCISVATDASWGNFTGWVLRRLCSCSTQVLGLWRFHRAPSIANHGVVVARIRWIFPNAPPWRFCQVHVLDRSTRGFGTSAQHVSCTFLYGRNHKNCVPCAYVLDNFAAARGRLIFQRFICRLPQRVLSQALPMLTHQWG